MRTFNVGDKYKVIGRGFGEVTQIDLDRGLVEILLKGENVAHWYRTFDRRLRMLNSYKIYSDGSFLGCFYAYTWKDAIQQAKNKYGEDSAVFTWTLS